MIMTWLTIGECECSMHDFNMVDNRIVSVACLIIILLMVGV
jgi:hypothetical protein